MWALRFLVVIVWFVLWFAVGLGCCFGCLRWVILYCLMGFSVAGICEFYGFWVLLVFSLGCASGCFGVLVTFGAFDFVGFRLWILVSCAFRLFCGWFVDFAQLLVVICCLFLFPVGLS